MLKLKPLKVIEHVKIEFFILIIRVLHVSSIDVQTRAIQTLSENEIIVYMKICSTHFKIKMSNICEFDRILKTKCNLQHFIRNCRVKNLDDFVEDKAEACWWRAGLLNVKEKRITICFIMKMSLIMLLRGGEVYVVQSIDETSLQR